LPEERGGWNTPFLVDKFPKVFSRLSRAQGNLEDNPLFLFNNNNNNNRKGENWF